MKAGDILLFKAEKDIVSKLIAWGTGSKYSHIALCVSQELNLAIEAMQGRGVRSIDIRKIQAPYDVYRVKATHAYDLRGTLSFLVSQLNSRYDKWGVIFLGLLKLIAKIGRPLKKVTNKWQKDRDYFCSELCYEAFDKGGHLDIVPQIDEAAITSPGDIAQSPWIDLIEVR